MAREAEGVRILQGLGFLVAYSPQVLIPTMVLNNIKSPQSRPAVAVGTSVMPKIEESSFSRPPNRKNRGGRMSRQRRRQQRAAVRAAATKQPETQL